MIMAEQREGDGTRASMESGRAETPASTVSQRIAAKQAQVLAELNECVNTLSSLHVTLDDIVKLTESSKDGDIDNNTDEANDSSGRQITISTLPLQMHRLLEELQEWQDASR